MSSGDYARSIATQENATALAMGDLSPDHMAICNWVTKKMLETPRIVMDGFPRSAEQFTAFDFSIVDCVIWVDTGFGKCLVHAAHRGRTDDEVRVFHRRYMNYMKHTAPLMESLHSAPGVGFIHFANDASLEEAQMKLFEAVAQFLEDRDHGLTN